METSKKIISPAAIVALKEALIHIYWKKADLKSFVYNTISNKPLVATIDWHINLKQVSADELISRMSARPDLYKSDLFALFEAVVNFNDFSHLKQWDEAEKKIAKAKEAVNAVRINAKGYFEHLEEEKKIMERKRATQENISSKSALTEKLEQLNLRFLNIAISSDAQQRGYALEKLLNDLFALFDLDPKASFKIIGEQIDGAFTFDNDDYLLEGKWQKRLVDAGDLYKFSSKVNGKRKNTLGLFFSMDGFSKECLQVNNHDTKSIILMDGADLNAVLTDRISLHDLLYRKRRHASETGSIYLSVTTILVS